MQITFTWNTQRYRADLSHPIDLAIPLVSGAAHQPNAYGAPAFEAAPVVGDNFIGSIEAGAPVNFFNIRLNPHGNGTHTECVGHILQGPYYIRECLQQSHYMAEVITVEPVAGPRGAMILREQIESSVMSLRRHLEHGDLFPEALVVRTLPNPEDKKTRRYTGTNPPWFDVDAVAWIREQGYQHLLTDLPSVDREEDEGRLAAHKAFWDISGEIRTKATITEMIFVPTRIPDGLYLLDLHNLAFDLDVSPSRPMLYVVDQE
jgi:kynurenine formamidase